MFQVLPCSGGSCPVNCKWEPWSSWTSCSKSGGNGGNVQECSQSRRRKMKQSQRAGGKPCGGDFNEKRFCVSLDCLGTEIENSYMNLSTTC